MSSLPRSKSRMLLAAATAVGAGLLFLGTPQPPAVAYCDHDFSTGLQRQDRQPEPAISGADTTACVSAQSLTPPDPSEEATRPSLATALAIALAANPSGVPNPANTSGAPSSSLETTLRAAISSNNSLIWPVKGPITQPFGVPELGVGAPHTGIDIGVDAGSPVRAAMAGRVVFAGGDPCCGLGYYIQIDHGNHLETVYGHFMRPPLLLSGDYVKQGQIVGFSGTTGFSTGPHLHFEVRVIGTPIDPLRVLPSR